MKWKYDENDTKRILRCAGDAPLRSGFRAPPSGQSGDVHGNVCEKQIYTISFRFE